MHECVVCGKRITWTFWICEKHRKEYGDNLRDWPPWLQYLAKQTRRERYAEKRDRERLEDLEYLDTHDFHVDPQDKDRFRKT